MDYIFKNTKEIQQNLIRIETAKKIIHFLPQLPHVEETLRRKSLLRSSLFSAQIEGNTLRIEELEEKQHTTEQNREKQEVFNILNALHWLYSKDAPQDISIDTLLMIHNMVMQDISFDAGKFRQEPSAIFNQAGVAIYMTPPPSLLPKLLEQLIKIANNKIFDAEHPAITSAMAHFAFEKIHPFIDGNGRVGRVLSTLILKNAGYDFRGLAVLEEYLNDNRETYYDELMTSTKDITGFIEFFTDAIATSAEKVIEQLQYQKEEKPEDTLLPRRQEILAIVREHNLVSFDFIRRRFVKIPESSLHYDLKMLIKQGFIKKLGTTRGVMYSPK